MDFMERKTSLLGSFKLLVISLVLWCCYRSIKIVYKWNTSRKIINKLPGPKTTSLFGNINLFLGQQNFFLILNEIAKRFKEVTVPIRIWIRPLPIVIINRAEDAYILLNSSKALEKSVYYKFFKTFLGDGLITSKDYFQEIKRLFRKLEQRQEENTPTSIFGQLLELTKIDSLDKWTEKEAIDELLTLYLTGFESSDTTTGFTLMLLGIYPHIQERLYSEIYEILGDSDRDITVQDLRKMVYMENVIKETLRFFPIGSYIARMTTETIEFENCKVPEGTDCMLALRDIQLNPKYWGEDCEAYDPDRFSPERSVGRHPAAFLAFSLGPRGCIGMKYSYIGMKVILSTLLRNYKILCNRKFEDLNVDISVLLKSKDGYKIALEERKNMSII